MTGWATIMFFSACSLVSKWLLYRQRRAVCCEMLLRHNWVGEARAYGRAEAFRSMFSRCFDLFFFFFYIQIVVEMFNPPFFAPPTRSTFLSGTIMLAGSLRKRIKRRWRTVLDVSFAALPRWTAAIWSASEAVCCRRCCCCTPTLPYKVMRTLAPLLFCIWVEKQWGLLPASACTRAREADWQGYGVKKNPECCKCSTADSVIRGHAIYCLPIVEGKRKGSFIFLRAWTGISW